MPYRHPVTKAFMSKANYEALMAETAKAAEKQTAALSGDAVTAAQLAANTTNEAGRIVAQFAYSVDANGDVSNNEVDQGVKIVSYVDPDYTWFQIKSDNLPDVDLGDAENCFVKGSSVYIDSQYIDAVLAALTKSGVAYNMHNGKSRTWKSPIRRFAAM